MGKVNIGKVSVESHIETEEVLKSLLDSRQINRSFVTDGGNGAIAEISLYPTAYNDELADILTSPDIEGRLERLGLEINEIED